MADLRMSNCCQSFWWEQQTPQGLTVDSQRHEASIRPWHTLQRTGALTRTDYFYLTSAGRPEGRPSANVSQDHKSTWSYLFLSSGDAPVPASQSALRHQISTPASSELESNCLGTNKSLWSCKESSTTWAMILGGASLQLSTSNRESQNTEWCMESQSMLSPGPDNKLLWIEEDLHL